MLHDRITKVEQFEENGVDMLSVCFTNRDHVYPIYLQCVHMDDLPQDATRSEVLQIALTYCSVIEG